MIIIVHYDVTTTCVSRFVYGSLVHAKVCVSMMCATMIIHIATNKNRQYSDHCLYSAYQRVGRLSM